MMVRRLKPGPWSFCEGRALPRTALLPTCRGGSGLSNSRKKLTKSALRVLIDVKEKETQNSKPRPVLGWRRPLLLPAPNAGPGPAAIDETSPARLGALYFSLFRSLTPLFPACAFSRGAPTHCAPALGPPPSLGLVLAGGGLSRVRRAGAPGASEA